MSPGDATPIFQSLVEQVRALLDEHAPPLITRDTDLRAGLAIDSLSYMALFFQVADSFDVDLAVIPPERFGQLRTLGDMADLLAEYAASHPS